MPSRVLLPVGADVLYERMTVYELIRKLPDVSVVRDRSRAMAMLDAVISPEREYRYFSFDANWSPGVETASMQDGSGNDYSICFSDAGAFARGFDHESPMSTYREALLALWPGLVDEVPGDFRQFVEEPAFADPDRMTLRATVCFWRRAADPAWRCGAVEIDLSQREDVDGANWLFSVLSEGTAEAYRSFAEQYYEVAPDLAAIRHVYDLRPLTDGIVAALNSELSLSDLTHEVSAIGYPL